MMEKNNQYSLADMRAYLRDELPERERWAMDEALLQDPLLAGAMEALEESLQQESIDEGSLDKITASFQEAIPGRVNTKSGGQIAYFSAPLVRRYAAIIVIFIAAGWLLNNYINSPSDPQSLFAENFEPYEDVINVRSEEGPEQLIKESMDFYNSGLYADALKGFKQAIQHDASQPFMLLYAANSALELGKSEEAISFLQTLDGLNNALLDDLSKWYLALAYLQKADTQGAEVYLTDLMKTKSQYARQAKNLLEELQ